MDAYNQAVKICLRLREEGYIAYFAGGWVRDWLLGHPSADIDIATNAPLSTLLALFPRTILVGMAFGVVIVQMEGHAFEVAIFRKDLSYSNGRKPDKIEPSNPEEDAQRRDFTINGLFYDPLEKKIWDFVGGEADLKRGVIKAIGDPYDRFQEDRLRMVRAVRFASRFAFHIDPPTEEAIQANAPTLFPAVAAERIYQEFTKMDLSAGFTTALFDLHRLQLLPEIFPSLKHLHLKALKAILHAIPPSIPTVAKLRELLKHLPLATQKEELLALKISAEELKMVEFLHHAERDMKEGAFREAIDWVRFYAHPFAPIAIALYGHGEEHAARQKLLGEAIERMRTKKPLVTASMLQERGIAPGKEMGALLKEAEAIAANRGLTDPEAVLKELHHPCLKKS